MYVLKQKHVVHVLRSKNDCICISYKKHKDNCPCSQCVPHSPHCTCHKCSGHNDHGPHCTCHKCSGHNDHGPHCTCHKCSGHNDHSPHCTCHICSGHNDHSPHCTCHICSGHNDHGPHCTCHKCSGHNEHKEHGPHCTCPDNNCGKCDTCTNHKRHKKQCIEKQNDCPKQYNICDNDCTDRNFINTNNRLRSKLGELQYKRSAPLPELNEQELRYEHYHFNGSFHKSLEHNDVTGSLKHEKEYKKMVKAILHNKQQLLASVHLNNGSQILLSNPLASLSSVLSGSPQPSLYLTVPPSLSSHNGGADMVENYCMAYTRDASFFNYDADATISLMLDSSHMNSPSILANLLYKPTGTFGTQTIFRGMSNEELVGPYISQLLLLNVPFGNGSSIMPQKYFSLSPRSIALGPVEWCINNTQVINIQNGLINNLPPLNPIDTTYTYIYNGRSLAEAVHNDSAYQYYYQAAQILTKLGSSPNPGFPSYKNQSPFITGPGLTDILCAIGSVTELALKHAYYWKWQVYRKLRPEVFGLWVSNVMTNLVKNHHNYDISHVLLNNGILNNIYGQNSSYTLTQCYREGCPVHPSYPAGHAVCAGANITLLKIFFDGSQPWATLPGVLSGLLGPSAGAMQADVNGQNLVPYVGIDSANMTVEGEINKLGSNVALGRDWAGIHYRSDSMAGMLLGEEIAIKYMEDHLCTMVENNLDKSVPAITFRKIDSCLYTVRPTLCK